MTTGTARVGDVTIEQVDITALADDDLVRFTRFVNAIRAEYEPADPPLTVESMTLQVRNVPNFVRQWTFFGRASGGEIVAEGQVEWAEFETNRHVADVGIDVLPAYRRRGVATELLRRLVDIADPVGRTTLIGRASDAVPSGVEFAKRVGGELGLLQMINRLVIDEVDRDMVDAWVEDGPKRAPGYSLVAADGEYPDEIIEQVIDLHTVMNTAPRDNMDVEDEPRLTLEQRRDLDRMFFATGVERWYLAARHDASGTLVGWTEVGWKDDTPATVSQWGTGVRPEHRGHAIGKWLKAVMLKRIMDERPYVTDIKTSNAESNDAMLGINNALGFRPYHSHEHWQVKTDRLRSYLEGTAR